MASLSTNNPTSAREWWTPREVANLLSYDASTVRRWCEGGKIDAARMPGGTWRICVGVVRALEEKGNPELRKRAEEKVGPEWTAATDYFDDGGEPSRPKARVRT